MQRKFSIFSARCAGVSRSSTLINAPATHLPGWNIVDEDTTSKLIDGARNSGYTEFVLRRNITISLDEKVARWARLKAAENDTSVSRLLADQLEQQMVRDSEYERARVQSRQQRSGEARHRI